MTEQQQVNHDAVEKDIKGLKKQELKDIIHQLAGELIKAHAQPEIHNEPSEYQGSKIGFLA